MSQLIDGRKAAQQVHAEVSELVTALKVSGINPSLKVILVGEDPASQVYVRNKGKRAAEVGIEAETVRLPGNASKEDIARCIQGFNLDDEVDGILLQLPLPTHLDHGDTESLLALIDPAKDVDGLHANNLGKLMRDHVGLRPCTPQGCMYLIEQTGVELKGLHAVVVGRSCIVGKPIAQMLTAADATVTLCHSKTRALDEICKSADLIVAAVGRPKFISGEWIKSNAIVIDVGINRMDNGRLCGDVDFDSAMGRAGFITPVPGGVGPLTIAFLLKNVAIAAKLRRRK